MQAMARSPSAHGRGGLFSEAATALRRHPGWGGTSASPARTALRLAGRLLLPLALEGSCACVNHGKGAGRLGEFALACLHVRLLGMASKDAARLATHWWS